MTDETEYDEGRRYDLKYFIDMAEDALDDVHRYSPDFYDQRKFDAAVTKANVYSTLATTVPKPCDEKNAYIAELEQQVRDLERELGRDQI
jgi:polyhydroxyalkanoate synthesis regulator phasin